MSFRADSVTVRYPHNERAAVRAVSLDVPRASVFAIIGPNGSGKSTLLRALLGAVATETGTVIYDNKPVSQWSRVEFARRVGVVTQFEHSPFPLAVRDLVALGRYPHLGALRPERDADRAAIESAMDRCDVSGLRDRPIETLSGGERQRARIARALAQDPETLVLDEPTAALDINHEMIVFELLRSLAHLEGRTVVVATHHINLAARYADHMLLLTGGSLGATGPARDVMRKDIIESAYGWKVAVHPHPGPGFDTGAPQVTPLSHT